MIELPAPQAMLATTPTILLVEDNPGDYRLVQEMLEDSAEGQFRLLHADQLASAAQVLERECVDLVLLDLRLPDGNGLDTLDKVHALAPDIPVVVLSHVEDESLAVKAVRMGAQDFLLKSNISGSLLVRSLRYALERRRLEAHLHHLAHHDALTGLANRKMFYDRLSRALASARRHQRPLALMLVDLNNFKQVNDELGHHVGDQLLRLVAGRLQSGLRASDCVARLGGDEFILYVGDLGDTSNAARVANKLLELLAPLYPVEERVLAVKASVGIALFPLDGDDMEVLVRRADAAMYQAKGRGREVSQFHFYSHDLDAAAGHRLALDTALSLAFERSEFVVNYQPQVDLHSGRLVGMEALLRWQKPDGETAMPAVFMPALEESGLIVAVGAWVLDTACRQVVRWCQSGLPAVKVAVNLSPRQLRDLKLVEQVAQALQDTGLEARLLELEFSEAALRDDEEAALGTLHRLNTLGVRLALDNFRGSTMSLGDLKRYPIHSVKIDRSIIHDMTDNPEDAAIAQAVISIAHVFKMKGLAEGVENLEQAELLRRQSCDDAQGYAFGKPLSAEAATALLHRMAGASTLQ